MKSEESRGFLGAEVAGQVNRVKALSGAIGYLSILLVGAAIGVAAYLNLTAISNIKLVAEAVNIFATLCFFLLLLVIAFLVIRRSVSKKLNLKIKNGVELVEKLFIRYLRGVKAESELSPDERMHIEKYAAEVRVAAEALLSTILTGMGALRNMGWTIAMVGACAGFATYLVTFMQVERMDTQNKMIEKQNLLLERQGQQMDIQNQYVFEQNAKLTKQMNLDVLMRYYDEVAEIKKPIQMSKQPTEEQFKDSRESLDRAITRLTLIEPTLLVQGSTETDNLHAIAALHSTRPLGSFDAFDGLQIPVIGARTSPFPLLNSVGVILKNSNIKLSESNDGRDIIRETSVVSFENTSIVSEVELLTIDIIAKTLKNVKITANSIAIDLAFYHANDHKHVDENSEVTSDNGVVEIVGTRIHEPYEIENITLNNARLVRLNLQSNNNEHEYSIKRLLSPDTLAIQIYAESYIILDSDFSNKTFCFGALPDGENIYGTDFSNAVFHEVKVKSASWLDDVMADHDYDSNKVKGLDSSTFTFRKTDKENEYHMSSVSQRPEVCDPDFLE